MTIPKLLKNPLPQFIFDLFRRQGEEPRSECGPLAPKKSDFSDEELSNFSQSDEVLDLTRKYIRKIRSILDSLRNEINIATEKIDIALPEKMANTFLALPMSKTLDSLPFVPEVAVPINIPSIASFSECNPHQTVNIPNINIQMDPAVDSPMSEDSPSAVMNKNIKPGLVPVSENENNKIAHARANFHIPNAKAGQFFTGLLEGKDVLGRKLKILDVRLSSDVGLTFDFESSELRGIPVVAGDHKIIIRWTAGDGVTQTAECVLIVNPDPRSLWKKLDSPADDPYFKKDSDYALVTGQDFKVVAASRRGRSHEHVGSPRDDDFFIRSDPETGWSVLIVADGAGSAKNSRWGSKLAVEAVGEHIYSNITTHFGIEMTRALDSWSENMAAASKAMFSPFYLLFQEASRLAVEAIENEAKAKGALSKDYSTTLLVAVTKSEKNETFLATFWMGDGAIAAYGPRGKVRLMGTPDSGDFAGQTRFLDTAALKDPNFGKRVGLGRFEGLKSVILMTDGVSDPFFETDNGLADASKWDSLWDEIVPCLNSADPGKELTDWLHFFTPGHHDDRTISIMW